MKSAPAVDEAQVFRSTRWSTVSAGETDTPSTKL
jgi:hypothetical protein